MKNTMKVIILITILCIAFSSISLVSSCGWFTYEDIEGTRSYYNVYDDLSGVEDSMLLVSRYPFTLETKKNVYIPMEENLNG